MKTNRIISPKLLKAAKGQECTLNTAKCNYDAETTVPAHINVDGGCMGGKTDDFSIAFACSECHAQIDGKKLTQEDELFYTRRGLVRTWKKLIEMGMINI